MSKIRIGLAVCGSFCTLGKTLETAKGLTDLGYEITPILSPIVQTTDTRFITAADFRQQIEDICNNSSITTIVDA